MENALGFTIEAGMIAAIVGGIITVIKPIIPNKYIPLISWIIAGLIGMGYGYYDGKPLFLGFVYGIVAGMGSNAIYDQIKKVRKPKEQGQIDNQTIVNELERDGSSSMSAS